MKRRILLALSIAATFLQLAFVVCSALATPQSDMPKGLWQAFSEARHQVEPVKGETSQFKAQSPKNHLVFRFSKDGFTIKSGIAGQDWSLTMQLAGYGQEDNILPVPSPELLAEGKRVEYRRGDIVEWYIS